MTDALTVSILDRLISKAQNEHKRITENHELTKTLAMRFPNMEYVDNDFMEEQKQNMLQITESNVERLRKLNNYRQALEQLRQGHHDNSIDYQARIEEIMAQSTSTTPMQQEEYYREMLTELGEEQQGDDDDIIIAGGQTEQSLKCPVTTILMEEPLKNSTCGHSYSKAGIMSLLKLGRTKCPVPGCGNSHVTKDQLGRDVALETLVRRERRRQEMAQQQASQADAISSDEE